MRVLQTFTMALKSIIHNKTRSFLTMLGIIIGVCSVITLVSVMQGSQDVLMENFSKMGTNIINVNYWNSVKSDFSNQLYQYCLGLEEVVGVTPQSQTRQTVRYKNKKTEVNIYFGNDKFDTCLNFELEAGRTISYPDIKNRVKVCVIGSYIKEQFFGQLDPVGKKIKIKGNEYTIIGVYKSKFDNSEWSLDNSILLAQSMQRTVTGNSQITNFVVKARDADSTETAITRIKQFMSTQFKNEWDYGVYSDNSWMEQVKQSNLMMTLLVGGIAGISLLVGGIGIMNIMLVTVAERTREIGIRMAIGAKRRDIVIQFLIEAATISACGGIIGIALGFAGSAILSALIVKSVYFPSMVTTLGAFAFSVALGVFFGFYPANKASKMQPVDALRNQ